MGDFARVRGRHNHSLTPPRPASTLRKAHFGKLSASSASSATLARFSIAQRRQCIALRGDGTIRMIACVIPVSRFSARIPKSHFIYFYSINEIPVSPYFGFAQCGPANRNYTENELALSVISSPSTQHTVNSARNSSFMH